MHNNIFMDDGHYLDEEDFAAFVQWKVKDLMLASSNDETIILFYENEEWQKQTRKILRNEEKF